MLALLTRKALHMRTDAGIARTAASHSLFSCSGGMYSSHACSSASRRASELGLADTARLSTSVFRSALAADEKPKGNRLRSRHRHQATRQCHPRGFVVRIETHRSIELTRALKEESTATKPLLANASSLASGSSARKAPPLPHLLLW